MTLTALLSACGVGKSATTANSFTCNPTSTDLTNYAAVYGSLSGNGCLVCHGNQPPEQPWRTRFHLNTDPAQTTAEQTENLCITYMFGQLSPSQAVATHPQDVKHVGSQNNGGNAYTATQLATIINWVNNYRLPTP